MRSRGTGLPLSARTSGSFASSTAGTRRELGELMGWPSNSTVCAAEGHRNGRQRGFTTQEIERLAAVFGVPPSQLTMRVRELRRAAAHRVRLPDLRSPAPDRPQTRSLSSPAGP